MKSVRGTASRASCAELDLEELEAFDGASSALGSTHGGQGEGVESQYAESSVSGDSIAAVEEIEGDDDESNTKEGEDNKPDKQAHAKAKTGKKDTKKEQTKGSIPCRGCPKMFLQHDMYPGGNMCRPCKKAYDCLHRLARRDGGKVQTWWLATRDSEKDLRRVIRKFKSSCPDLGIGRGKSRVKSFSVAEYIESVRVLQAKERRHRGEYVTDVQFKEFAMSRPPHGWGLSSEQAQLHWTESIKDQKPLYQRRGGNSWVDCCELTGKSTPRDRERERDGQAARDTGTVVDGANTANSSPWICRSDRVLSLESF
eukprot:6491068-Amphidinium_carterae.1